MPCLPTPQATTILPNHLINKDSHDNHLPPLPLRVQHAKHNADQKLRGEERGRDERRAEVTGGEVSRGRGTGGEGMVGKVEEGEGWGEERWGVKGEERRRADESGNEGKGKEG